MSTYKYKSEAVTRDIVQKSAAFGMFAGLLVNLPLAVQMIGVSVIAGCYERSDYLEAFVFLPATHILVFLLTFIIMCSMYIVIESYKGDVEPKK